MIYLIPFLNCFLLYICKDEKQLLYKSYTWITENIFVYLPQWTIKILGDCVLCTSFWMGIIQIAIYGYLTQYEWNLILAVFYNAIGTNILYKLNENS